MTARESRPPGPGLGALLLGLLAACPTTPAVTRENAAEVVGSALCDWLVRCRHVTTRDPETCRSLLDAPSGSSTFDGVGALFASIEAGRVTVDAGRAGECVTTVRALACGASVPRLAALEPCQAAFLGTLDEGGACIVSEACRRGLSCVAVDPGRPCDGRCERLPAGSCHRGADCGDGLACEAGRCVARRGAAAAGDVCGLAGGCADGLACVADLTSDLERSLCRKAAGEGETCVLGGPGCAGDGTVCVPEAGFERATCRRALEAGAACVLPFECDGLGGRLVCGGGSCVARPAEGPCVVVGALGVCDPERAFCDFAAPVPACRAFRPAGEACASDADCGPARRGRTACLSDDAGVRRCAELAPPLRCTP